MDYLAYALLILALYKWWRYKRLYVEKASFCKIQRRIITQQQIEIATNDELKNIKEHRLEIAGRK